MKKDLTELVFILDKSGSMSGLEKDTIGGYNAFLKKQQKIKGACRITTVLFDNNYELLHDRIDLEAIKPLTEKDYEVGGSTALLDAVGMTINKLIAVQKNTSEKHQARKVLFVIITDGMENSSKEYSTKSVKDLIEQQKKVGWEFIFLGANIDAVSAASTIGINPDRAQNYQASGVGVKTNYSRMSETVSDFRTKAKISDNWKKTKK